MLPEPLLRTSVKEGRVLPHWFSAADHPWLRRLIDEYERAVGRPRRELVERLRDPRGGQGRGARRGVVVHVLDQLYRTEKASAFLGAAVPGGRPARGGPPASECVGAGAADAGGAPRKPTARALTARRIRETVFAEAAVAGPGPREAVIERAAAALGLLPDDVEAALFGDLPGERRVGPAAAHVDPAGLAVRANLALAQGVVFRAARVRLDLEGNARDVIRLARLRGLICTVQPRGDPQEATLELSGPFSIFRRTTLYGRALAEVVPRLAWCDRFVLEADVVLGGQTARFELRTGDPILPAAEPRRFDSKLEERFARAFARAAPAWDLVREPEPLDAGGALIFPDFALQHRHDPGRRWLLEVVGFWTRDYLEEKLRRLRAAGVANLIVCVDADRNVGRDDLPEGATLITFRRSIDPAAVLAVIDPSPVADPAPAPAGEAAM